MSKGKSLFVTVLVGAMLMLIDIGLYMIYQPGFAALTGALAMYGFFSGASDFRHWLEKVESFKAEVMDDETDDDSPEVFDWAKDADFGVFRPQQERDRRSSTVAINDRISVYRP